MQIDAWDSYWEDCISIWHCLKLWLMVQRFIGLTLVQPGWVQFPLSIVGLYSRWFWLIHHEITIRKLDYSLISKLSTMKTRMCKTVTAKPPFRSTCTLNTLFSNPVLFDLISCEFQAACIFTPLHSHLCYITSSHTFKPWTSISLISFMHLFYFTSSIVSFTSVGTYWANLGPRVSCFVYLVEMCVDATKKYIYICGSLISKLITTN